MAPAIWKVWREIQLFCSLFSYHFALRTDQVTWTHAVTEQVAKTPRETSFWPEDQVGVPWESEDMQEILERAGGRCSP